VPIKRTKKNEQNQLTPEGMVKELISTVQFEIQFSSSRLQDFIREYRKQIVKLPNWEFTAAGRSERDILDLFKAPLIMYDLKLNGQVIIEIYGILERYAISAIVNLFNADPDKKSTIELLTRQCSLVKLAKIPVIFKLWHKEDITFAENLYDHSWNYISFYFRSSLYMIHSLH
jgi:hypothetical protein